ncbi:MAG: phosphodiesterase [Clostridia bacterium]|nr:phosphodiesterase [Clostridia bacterium]
MELSFLKNIPVAHRGLHNETLPENGMGAFRAAMREGYTIETDVRLSKDGEIMVFHDDHLFRMTGANLAVADCTAEELSRLKLGESNERIPLFSEFLSTVDGQVPLLIEIKNMPSANTKTFIAKIADALKNYGGLYAVQSFSPFYVKEFKALRPDIPCGILATASSCKADFGGSAFWRIKARAVKNMSFNKRIKPDFISYHFKDYPQKATENFQGLKLAWTIRSPEDEAYARKYADNIIFENYVPEK